MRTDTLLKCDADDKDDTDAAAAAMLGVGRVPDCRRDLFIHKGRKKRKKVKKSWRGQIRVRVSERLKVRGSFGLAKFFDQPWRLPMPSLVCLGPCVYVTIFMLQVKHRDVRTLRWRWGLCGHNAAR